MKRFIIEREIPGVGALDQTQLRDAAAQSNKALAELAGKAQWQQSYVVDPTRPSASTSPRTRPRSTRTPS